MKKFNLLLATTAILAVGAMSSSATDVGAGSLTLTAKVNFAKDFEISELRPISFGTILNPQNEQYLRVSRVEGIYDGTAKVIGVTDLNGGPKPGLISITKGYTPNNLVFSGPSTDEMWIGSVQLKTSDGKRCGLVEPSTIMLRPDESDDDYNVYAYGGTFTVDMSPSEWALSDYEVKECTASIVATIIFNIEGPEEEGG